MAPVRVVDTRNITIPAGTEISVRTIDSVDSKTAHENETFHASIDFPVIIDRQTVLPKGADVYLKVIHVSSAGQVKGQSEPWDFERRFTPRGVTIGVDRDRHLAYALAWIGFEPGTESQKVLHAETLRAYNEMIKARRMRLDAVQTGLPTVMWVLIIVGAFIGMSASFFFKVEDVRLQSVQGLLLATFIGLIIFMIFALDRPFRGDLGVRSEPYELIYDQLMK